MTPTSSPPTALEHVATPLALPGVGAREAGPAGIGPGHLFSQHSLGTYARCPRRFLFKYVERQPWPMPEPGDARAAAEHLARGRTFHQWMVRRHLGLPMEGIAAACEDAELATWWRDAAAFPWEALPGDLREAELPLVVPLGEFRLYARLDLLALDRGGEAVIVDWKTLGARPSPRTLQTRLQTRIYLYTVAAAGPLLNGGGALAPECVRMLYWFANYPNEPYTVRYSRQEFEEDGRRLLRLAREIAATPPDGYERAVDPRECPRCTYRTLCERDAEDPAGGEDWLDEDLAAALDGGLDAAPELEY